MSEIGFSLIEGVLMFLAGSFLVSSVYSFLDDCPGSGVFFLIVTALCFFCAFL